MAGFPDYWEVRTRNRQYSNQPGGLAKPVQEMVREFSPSSPKSQHMRAIADVLRSEAPLENSMNYQESNQPDSGEDYAYVPDD